MIPTYDGEEKRDGVPYLIRPMTYSHILVGMFGRIPVML